jgi:hypothetical protein
MRKKILEWLFANELKDYWDLLNENIKIREEYLNEIKENIKIRDDYIKELESHSKTLSLLKQVVDVCKKYNIDIDEELET